MELGRLLSILLLGLICSGCGVTQVLDRAPDGTAIIIRSPQPDAGDLNTLHAEHGLKTVFNLRGENPDRGWFQEEAAGVKAIGARWVHVPLSGSRPPSPEQIEQFFDLVEDPANWPILIHCQGGIHRTGAFAALYRMQYQGWSGNRAVYEMEKNFFNWSTRDRTELKEWLRRYTRDPKRVLPETKAAKAAN